VVLECHARLHDAVQALLDRLRILSDQGTPLHDGSKIQYGWSILTLRAEGDAVRVCEPAFAHNPLAEISPTIDNTLKILTEQEIVLRRSGLKGVDVLFSDDLFVRNQALEAPNLFLKRQPPAGPNDSGWYIGNLDRIDSGDPETSSEVVQVYELLRRRPAVMQVLTLPPAYVVLMRHNEVVEILDREGNNYWIEAAAEERHPG